MGLGRGDTQAQASTDARTGIAAQQHRHGFGTSCQIGIGGVTQRLDERYRGRDRVAATGQAQMFGPDAQGDRVAD